MNKILENIKTLAFSDPDIPIHKRRVVRIITPSKLAGELPVKIYFLGVIAILEPIWNKYISKNVVLLDYDLAIDRFKFLPDHPLIDGEIYACSELFPNLYIPLNRFNEYLLESKIEALHSMCAALGAKSCMTTSVIVNGAKYDMTIEGNYVAISGKTGLSESINTSNIKKINDHFIKPVRTIEEFDSPWLISEPSWANLQRIRLENKNIEKREISFRLTHNSVNSATIAAKYAGLGGLVGSTQSDTDDVSLEIEVTFYPYPEH